MMREVELKRLYTKSSNYYWNRSRYVHHGEVMNKPWYSAEWYYLPMPQIPSSVLTYQLITWWYKTRDVWAVTTIAAYFIEEVNIRLVKPKLNFICSLSELGLISVVLFGVTILNDLNKKQKNLTHRYATLYMKSMCTNHVSFLFKSLLRVKISFHTIISQRHDTVLSRFNEQSTCIKWGSLYTKLFSRKSLPLTTTHLLYYNEYIFALRLGKLHHKIIGSRKLTQVSMTLPINT